MSNIRCNITELLQVLDIMPAEHNIMLVGNHGIGKSEILTEYYKAIGMKVVALFLGQMSDPGDLIGLPHKDEATGKTDFMPPYLFPIDGKPVCLFLDELNRARPEILQTIMDLALNRKLAGRRRVEFNPEFVSQMTDEGLEEGLKTEGIKILLKHPYERKPDQCCDQAIALGSNITIGDQYHYGNFKIEKPQDFGLEYNQPAIPEGMKCKIIWVCEDKSSYEKNHRWMEHSGRVCTIELH